MKFETRKSIFPVLLLDLDGTQDSADRKVINGRFLGSGFFVQLTPEDKNIIFVTARHVVAHKLEAHQRIGIGCLYTKGYFWWNHFKLHNSADLAVAQVIRATMPEWIAPLPVFSPSETLELGTAVFSFGFPLSTSTRDVKGKFSIELNEVFYAGYISSIHDRQYLTNVFMPYKTNYSLSFECPKGLSGAPLMIRSLQRGPVVCGVVYGNRTTQYLIESREELQSGNVIERESSYRYYHFGLASSMAEFLDPYIAFQVKRDLYSYPIQDES